MPARDAEGMAEQVASILHKSGWHATIQHMEHGENEPVNIVSVNGTDPDNGNWLYACWMTNLTGRRTTKFLTGTFRVTGQPIIRLRASNVLTYARMVAS